MLSKYNTIFLLACLLSSISGCAIVPNLTQQPQIQNIKTIGIEQSLQAKYHKEWPKANWWDAYNDSQLDILINEAYLNSPLIAEADARVKKALALAGEVNASLYPHIGVSAGYESIRLSYNLGIPQEVIPHNFNDFASATLNMSFELDFWGKNRNLLAAATSQAEAISLEREHTRLIISTSIATAYAQLAQLYATLDNLNDSLKIHTKMANLIKQKEAKGLENKSTYEQEVAIKSSLEAQIAALNEAIDLVKNQIAVLIGKGPDRALTITRPNINNLKPFGLPNNLPAEFIGHRPDIIAARLFTEAALKNIAAAKASFYPNINLIGFAGHQALGLNYFTSADSFTAGVGPAISLPIFDGSFLRSQYRLSRAAYDETVAVYDETLLHALNEVANVVTNEKWLALRLQKTDAAVKAATEVYNVANNRYKHGLVSYLTVLQAEDSLVTIRRSSTELQTRKFILDISLVRALGGGFTVNNKISKGN